MRQPLAVSVGFRGKGAILLLTDQPTTDDPDAAYMVRSADDPLFFGQGLVIPSASGEQRFWKCMQDFQLDCFRDLVPSLLAIRNGTMPLLKRFWIERTKKAGKDSDLAACLLWLMAFARRPCKCQVCASNNKQARIVENRAVELLHYNPWLNGFVEIVQSCIRSRAMPREAWVHIESTGSEGASQGETPDLLVLNELVHVDKWPVMKAHMNNAAGVPRGVVIVSTNAGVKGSEAWTWRRNALAHPDRWKVHIWNKLAPWLSEEDVEEDRRLDPIGAHFARLWKGIWISGTGGAVDEATIGRSFVLDGPSGPEPGWAYLMALDMGETHDHSGVIVIGVNMELRKIKVCRLKGFVPDLPNDAGKLEVNKDAVCKYCLEIALQYNVGWFGFDPAAGGRFVAQDLRREGIPMVEMTFGSRTNQTSMATAFVQAMNNGILQCYDDSEGRLRRDIGKFSIKVTPPNIYRLEAVSDEFGHADVGTALVICLPRALEMLGEVAGWGPDDVAAYVDDTPLTEEEKDDMDPELREIYDMDEEDERALREIQMDREDEF